MGKTITNDRKREIAQLLFVAKNYLILAAPAANITDKFLNQTKTDFSLSAELSTETRNLTMIGAHLSSAAIRLTSIDEVMRKEGHVRKTFSECRDYFSGKAESPPKDHRAQECSEWLHVMLRDNAGHEEPDQLPTKIKERRWRERQNFLQTLTFAQAYEKLCEIDKEISNILKNQHGIETK